MGAPDLTGDWHYRVVDSKFATLDLVSGGGLGNSGSAAAYKVQVFIYGRALGRNSGVRATATVGVSAAVVARPDGPTL